MRALMLLIAGVLALGGYSALGNPPPDAAGQFSAWFKSQKQEDSPSGGSCCGDEEHAGGDGHYVEVHSDETAQGIIYRVFIKEIDEWVIYPRAVNPNINNPTARNVAWYTISGGKIRWYCLRLSSGT